MDHPVHADSDATVPALLAGLSQDGYALLPGVFEPQTTAAFGAGLATALAAATDRAAVRGEASAVYAARNVLDLWPEAVQAWRTPRLVGFLRAVLGAECGLVRGLYFDKPPEKSWALPFHQDIQIAVQPPEHESPLYSPVRRKAGEAHVEPPEEVLAGMLTLRIHFDAATPDNGPLEVIPGSHASGKRDDAPARPAVTIYAAAGDVLAMRPLLLHASGRSAPGTTQHRRILHLEFAATRELPAGYQWRWFFLVEGERVIRRGGCKARTSTHSIPARRAASTPRSESS